MKGSRARILVGAAAMLAFGAGGASAQGLTVTPMFGAYTQASSFQELRGNAESIRVKRKSDLALGAAVGLGPLRGSVAYVTGATLSQKGVTGGDEIGEGKMLTGAVDAVVRPIPRIAGLQPYLLGGIGLKQADYNFDDARFSGFDTSESDAAFHLGVGADWMFGPVGVMAEISDFISGGDGDASTQHDAYGLVGLRVKLF